jgi:hypothetical protein
MLNFKQFVVNEAESPKTSVQKIKTELSQKFDAITTAKDAKKPGDTKSEIDSINKQAALYLEISTLMRSLSTEMQKAMAAAIKKPKVGGQTGENIY